MWHLSMFLLTVLKQARARVGPRSWLWWRQRPRLHGLQLTRGRRASASYALALRHPCREMTRIFRQKWQLRQGLWNQPSLKTASPKPVGCQMMDKVGDHQTTSLELLVCSFWFYFLPCWRWNPWPCARQASALPLSCSASLRQLVPDTGTEPTTVQVKSTLLWMNRWINEGLFKFQLSVL